MAKVKLIFNIYKENSREKMCLHLLFHPGVILYRGNVKKLSDR